MQLTLSGAQIARFTWVGEPTTQAVEPVFAKNTANVPVSPGLSTRKALSNWYEESKPTAAWAGCPVKPRVMLRASAAAVIAVEIRRMCTPFSFCLRSAPSGAGGR